MVPSGAGRIRKSLGGEVCTSQGQWFGVLAAVLSCAVTVPTLLRSWFGAATVLMPLWSLVLALMLQLLALSLTSCSAAQALGAVAFLLARCAESIVFFK